MTQYENRIVLFLDILGFKEIVDKTVDNGLDKQDKIEKLYKSLLFIKEEVSRNKGTSKVVTQFSDSIVISFKENDAREFIPFFQSILFLLIKLLEQGILCRGAISYGKLIHTDEIVFGPALNEAYITELKAALYPRVILDRSVVDKLRTIYKAQNKDIIAQMRFDPEIRSRLKIDTDDKLFLDYFEGALMVFNDTLILDYFADVKKLISEGLLNKSPGIKIKYGWMKNKFNRFLEDIPAIQYEYNLNHEYLTRLARTEKII